MKHPHHDIIVAWVADTSRVVQVNDPRFANACWVDITDPTWKTDLQYRFKPKPDRVEHLNITRITSALCFGDQAYPTLIRTFDGETGALKGAEVLK